MRRACICLLLAGCAHDVPPSAVTRSDTVACRATGAPNQVDLLFMIDNSNGVGAINEEMKVRFPLFTSAMTDLAAHGHPIDLHIGVVTSDYGAGATGAPGCQPSPGGQLGKLQPIGVAAAAACRPPMGANFIQYQFAGVGAGPNNLPMGQNLVDTFSCVASVGEGGCGFEHPLESVFAAFSGLPENAGFVRDDAALAIVFVTNEDDSSAPPDTDMFDKNKTAQYGYEDSYRSTRFGIVCGDPPSLPPYASSNGPLEDCRPAPNPPGKEYDVQRYVDRFTKSSTAGGIKLDPANVILFALDGDSAPVEVLLSNPGTPQGSPYLSCDKVNEASNPPCLPVLQHVCVNQDQPAFVADPAVRLNAVVDAAATHARFSVCDGDYTAFYRALAQAIASQLGECCLPAPPAQSIDCTVQDVTTADDGTTTTTDLPRCGLSHSPCWRVETKPACPGFGVTVDRDGKDAPPHTITRAACVPAG